MKKLFIALNRRPVRTSTVTSLETSTSFPIPPSAPAALENSQGGSAAVAELSTRLDEALEQADFEGDISELPLPILDQLEAEANKYQNSSLAFCSPLELWKCNKAEAARIALAWDCAANAYVGYSSKLAWRYECTSEQPIESSIGGTIKQTTFTVVSEVKSSSFEPAHPPLLVIAIRGSKAIVDHIVNLNGDQKDTSSLFSSQDAIQGDTVSFDSIRAHAGFLNCAVSLKERVSFRIQAFLEKHPKGHVLFTGHSAGGAVATLLHLFSRSRFADASTSCITFGSPPVAALPFGQGKYALDQWKSASYSSLNIINEFDLVARADKPYVHSLVDLYNSARAVPFQNRVGTTASPAIWPVSNPSLYHIGDIVVLQKKLSPEYTDLVLETRLITPEQLASVVFCRVSVHKRDCYGERIKLLQQGYFNGKAGWDKPPR